MNERLSSSEEIKDALREIMEQQINPFPLIERMIQLMVPVDLAKEQVRINTQQLSTMQGFHPDKAYIQLLHDHHVQELRSSIDDLKQFAINRINTLIEQIGNIEELEGIQYEMNLEYIRDSLTAYRQDRITVFVEEFLNGEPTMENLMEIRNKVYFEKILIREALRTLKRFIERLDGEDVPEDEREFQLPFDI